MAKRGEGEGGRWARKRDWQRQKEQGRREGMARQADGRADTRALEKEDD